MALRVLIATPERLFLDASADMVVAPGEEGELGILPHHTPLLSTLREGVVRVKRGGQTHRYSVGEGVVEVCNNKVILLVRECREE
jgi:F-type H+-transporting ATPase subunit epsilon